MATCQLHIILLNIHSPITLVIGDIKIVLKLKLQMHYKSIQLFNINTTHKYNDTT